MHTYLDCLPCFFRQAIDTMRRIRPQDVSLHKRGVDELCKLVPSFDLSLPPPALAGEVYKLLSNLLGVQDPFKEIKKEANAKVLSILPRLRSLVSSSSNPLRRALHLSIIGNYIDAGIAHEFDWERALYAEEETFGDDAFVLFQREIEKNTPVMILGDNAGEIALDLLLVEELRKRDIDVVYVVRGGPILNDATYTDAREVGMSHICEVISSGVNTPGTVLSQCAKDFLERMYKAPLILSKGQGNFESLKDRFPRRIFYAFKVKCKVVEDITSLPLGTSVFAYW